MIVSQYKKQMVFKMSCIIVTRKSHNLILTLAKCFIYFTDCVKQKTPNFQWIQFLEQHVGQHSLPPSRYHYLLEECCIVHPVKCLERDAFIERCDLCVCSVSTHCVSPQCLHIGSPLSMQSACTARFCFFFCFIYHLSSNRYNAQLLVLHHKSCVFIHM